MSFSAAALAGIGSLVSLIGSGGSMMNSAISTNRQYKHQLKLLERQFEYNRWLASHAHQMEVGDLRSAGLNPVLSATGGSGASASVGLPSVGLSDDMSLGNTMSDAVNTAVQNATSAKAVDSQASINKEQEKLIQEQAKTEENKRTNLDSQSKFNLLQSEGKAIENLHLPEYLKSQIRNNNSSAKASLIDADANLINATSGNPTKVISDVINNPESTYKKLKNSAKSFGNAIKNDMKNFKNPIIQTGKALYYMNKSIKHRNKKGVK